MANLGPAKFIVEVDLIKTCFFLHRDKILKIIFANILPSLTANRFFAPDAAPGKELPNIKKLEVVLQKVENGIKESDRSYFWKLVNALEGSYPELTFAMCDWLDKHGYHCEEIQLMKQSWRIAFILLVVGLGKYINNFESHDLFYLEDLMESNNSDLSKLIENPNDLLKFNEAAQPKREMLGKLVPYKPALSCKMCTGSQNIVQPFICMNLCKHC